MAKAKFYISIEEGGDLNNTMENKILYYCNPEINEKCHKEGCETYKDCYLTFDSIYAKTDALNRPIIATKETEECQEYLKLYEGKQV